MGKFKNNPYEPYDRLTEEKPKKKWFHLYPLYKSKRTSSEESDLKETELFTLRRICKEAYEQEFPKSTPSGQNNTKWLETALYKGTAKDKVSAAGMLIISNPMESLEVLDKLADMSKISNKNSPDAIQMLTDLYKDELLPKDRKLVSIEQRGSIWKWLLKQDDMNRETKTKIFAFWHFESEIKERYVHFLDNLQITLRNGKNPAKNSAIVNAKKLLITSPEKEHILLAMLINKLGDPISEVASKALYHLSEVVYKHPNMCPPVIDETERLLFRNNLADKAQYFALCFLAQIPYTGKETCKKVVDICFAFFKTIVQKGAINGKTMQAILRCLRKALSESDSSDSIMSKDIQDAIYRLVHLAEIRISVQALSLLLEIAVVRSSSADRFYNALYRKWLDMNVQSVGAKTAAQLLHITHQAIRFDQNIDRAKAFVKRLLHVSLYMPQQIVCGCLIVVIDLMRTKFHADTDKLRNILKNHSSRRRTNSDSKEAPTTLSTSQDEDATEIGDYNPYQRVPSIPNADLHTFFEFHLLSQHFHPTVGVIVEKYINDEKNDYYGDPLRDFCLSKFLEKFCFKNPKKNIGEEFTNTAAISTQQQKRSKTGSEDKQFILKYLEERNKNTTKEKKVRKRKIEDVSDDEFEEYLDSLTKRDKSLDDIVGIDEDLKVDYYEELEKEFKNNQNKKTKKKQGNEDGEDDESDDDELGEDDELFDDEMNSDDFDEIDDESEDGCSDTKENTSRKKFKMSEKSEKGHKGKKGKDPSDMSSLFVPI